MRFFIYQKRIHVLVALLALTVTSCAQNPLRHRLAQNFVYNCALGLIEEGVSPMEADQICRSAHASEIQEIHIRAEKNKAMAAESREAAQRLSESNPSDRWNRSPASQGSEQK